MAGMNGNGNGIGRGNGTGLGARMSKRLAALLEQRDAIQRQIDGYQFVMSDLIEAQITRKQAADTVVNQAIALEHVRRRGRQKNPGGVKKKKPGYNTKEAMLTRRLKTAAFLARFNARTPTPPTADFKQYGLGPLVHGGYLKRKGTGFVRTAKEFRP